MACNRLDEHDVPYYRRQETSGGLEVAMPAAAAPAPGVWFTVWVPDDEIEAALEVLRDLPIELDREPDVLDRAITPRNRRLVLGGATVLLALFLLGFFQQCAGAIRGLAR